MHVLENGICRTCEDPHRLVDGICVTCSPAEMSGRSMASFNPAEPRDPDGKWTDGPAGAVKDALKLAGKIELDKDEHLIGSGKLDGEDGGIRLALTEQHGHRMLRLGAGPWGYGKPDRSAGIKAWDGGPPSKPLSHHEQQHLEDELDALGSEYDSASPARREEISAREDEINAQLNQQEFNGTAKLDEHGMSRLIDKIRPALAEAVDREKAENKAHDQIEAGQTSPELQKLVDRSEPITFTKGVIPGSDWGDVHYSVELDDITVGPEVYIGVTPKGAPEDWGDDKDWKGTFTAAETRRFLRLIDQMMPPSS